MKKCNLCVIALSCIAMGLAVTACNSDKKAVEDTRATVASTMSSEAEAEPTKDTQAPTAAPTRAVRLVTSTEYGYEDAFTTPHGNYGTKREDDVWSSYNEKGQVTAEYRSDGSCLTYTYNENDQLAQIDWHTEETGSSPIMCSKKYEYDGDKLVHSYMVYADDEASEYEVEEVTFTEVREYEDWTYEYDDDGVRVSGVCDFKLNNLTEKPSESLTKTLYFYDDEGRVIREEKYQWNGKDLGDAVSTKTYEYDSDGFLIRAETYSIDLDCYSTEEREYDEYGTLSKRNISNKYMDPEKCSAPDSQCEVFYDNEYIYVDAEGEDIPGKMPNN